MQEYEKGAQRGSPPPAWQSSQGRLREAAPTPKKDGRDQLTGYRPPADRGKDSPRETGRLSSSYGDVAVGSDRKKNLTLVASKRRSSEGPAATEDEKMLHSDSANRVELPKGNVETNAHDERKSAVAGKAPHKKPPAQLLTGFRTMMRTREGTLLDEQLPFLDQTPERDGLRQLKNRGEELRAQGPEAHAALGAVERSKQQLRQTLTEKKTQEQRLLLLLQQAQEASRRRAGEANLGLWAQPTSEEELPEPPPEGGDGDKRSVAHPAEEADGLADQVPDADPAPDQEPAQ